MTTYHILQNNIYISANNLRQKLSPNLKEIIYKNKIYLLGYVILHHLRCILQTRSCNVGLRATINP